MAPIHVQRLGPQRTDLEPWFLGRWGGGVYTQQTLSLTEYIIRNQNYSEWQLLSSGETLLWPLAAAQSPKWSKMVPKLTIWNIQAALCPRLSKMVPTLAIWSIWGPWVQYMYRDRHPSELQTCRGRSVRLGNSLHRAESPLHVWGKGHPVQRALCTFMGKGTMAPI